MRSTGPPPQDPRRSGGPRLTGPPTVPYTRDGEARERHRAAVHNRCGSCWYWDYEQSDDANERYGKCRAAYQGADEAHPWSNVLLKLEGPEAAARQVIPSLLTHERHRCELHTADGPDT